MTRPGDSLDAQVLAAYFAGECSTGEAAEVERWIAAAPGRREEVERLRAVWQRAGTAGDPGAATGADAAWLRMAARMRAQRRSPEQGTPRPPRELFAVLEPRRRPVWRAPLAAAAAIAVLAAGISLFVLPTSRDTPPPAAEPMREYATPRGQRATFQLADGTQLTLAAASRLRVPGRYGRGVREVYLEGEALFEVVHDSTRPFRVRARSAVAEVLGTRFDVRAYAEDSVVAVAVAEGAVALDRAGASHAGTRPAGDVAQGVVLRRGDLGTLAPDGRVTTATGAVVASYLAWAEGRLQFVETPLTEVVLAVGRWYDLDVRVASPALAARTVTAEFGAQSAEELMRALALALDARVTRSGRVITLRSRS